MSPSVLRHSVLESISEIVGSGWPHEALHFEAAGWGRCSLGDDGDDNGLVCGREVVSTPRAGALRYAGAMRRAQVGGRVHLAGAETAIK